MARTKAIDSPINRFKFTRASVDSATCPTGKLQAIFRDTEQPALMLRVTTKGARSFIFEQRLAGKTVRVTIGPASMQIRAAKDRSGRPLTAGADVEAARLAGQIAQGIDPRAAKAATIAGQESDRAVAKVVRARLAVFGLDAWASYLEDRRPHWGALNYADHLRYASAGGEPRCRAKEKLTKPGPLRTLLARPLVEIDSTAVEAWVGLETKQRPTTTALGFRLLRAFLNWCAEHPDYRMIVNADACKAKRTRAKLAKPAAKDDALQREQLKVWFTEVEKLSPTISSYLKLVLLTGCRPGEALNMRWVDVDFRWNALVMRDKVEGERTIPLTPYLAALLRDLAIRNETPPKPPRRLRAALGDINAGSKQWTPSAWVFRSATSASGRLSDVSHANHRALTAAGLPHITPHGLRRSFGTLAEWVEVPVGIVAQIQGHKPSAIAEKHYRVRPLDLLRMWHERIEAWVLVEAGIALPEKKAAGRSIRIASKTALVD